jgi:hypothetical protein
LRGIINLDRTVIALSKAFSDLSKSRKPSRAMNEKGKAVSFSPLKPKAQGRLINLANYLLS